MYKNNFAIQTLKQRSFKAKVKRKLHSDEVDLIFDKNAKYIYFVLSDKNNTPANLQTTKDLAKRLDSIEMYTVLSNMHPNEYGIDILEAKNKVKDHLNYLDIQSFDAIMKAALI